MAESVLLTGASGFLGRYIYKSLLEKYDNIVTLGRNSNDTIKFDFNESHGLNNLGSYSLVVHSAGKAHSVPKTEAEKQAFFDVNVKGTENLLKGLEQSSSLPKSFIFISSVSVYGVENGINIDEDYPLAAIDPYGLSKIQAEKIVIDWCKRNNVICGILRLPLLVGANPPGNLGAMIKGIRKGYYFNIAGGKAKKSMVMVEDVVNVIPKVAEIGGTYNLTDGYHPGFYELSVCIAKQLGKQKAYNIPRAFASFLALVGDCISLFPINSRKLVKITSDLTFDDSKARNVIGWNPSKVIERFEIE